MVIRIKVKPGSKVDKMAFDGQGTLNVWVKAPPVDGKANKYLINYFSEVLDIPKSSIQILNGESSQFKKISVEITENEFLEKVRGEL